MLNGYTASFGGDKSVLELDSDDGGTTLFSVLNAAEFYILKWLKWWILHCINCTAVNKMQIDSNDILKKRIYQDQIEFIPGMQKCFNF